MKKSEINRFKKLTSLLIVIAMLVQMAPEIICKAAESTYELIIVPKTPLDEVYFYSEDTVDSKLHCYGFLDGKVAVVDEDFKLIKKTEFDMFNTSRMATVNGVPAFIASKKVNEKMYYGILSSEGEILLEPDYSYLWINEYKKCIYVCKDINKSERCIGILDLNCNEIISCEYESAVLEDKFDDNYIIRAKKFNEPYNIILNDNVIWEGEEDCNYSCCFSEYEGEKCIKIVSYVYLDNVKKGKNIFVTYNGDIIYQDEDDVVINDYDSVYDEIYADTREKWLNDKSNKGKDHVVNFFESKNIDLENVENSTGYEVIECENYYDNKGIFYWVTISAEYQKNTDCMDEYDSYYDNNILNYTYIYNAIGECVISGRGFGKIGDVGGTIGDVGKRFRYLLSDDGKMRYLNYETMKVEELFDVDDSVLTYLDDYGRDSEYDPEMHKLYYDENGIIEERKGEKYKIYSYKDKKIYEYDYKYHDYYFIENNSDRTDIYYFNKENDGKWEKYNHIDLSIDKIKNYDKRSQNGICIDDDRNEKIIYISKDISFEYSYDEFEDFEISSLYDSIGNKNHQIIMCNTDDGYYGLCIDLSNGRVFELNMGCNKYEFYYIAETDGNLYIGGNHNIAVINKKTHEINIINTDFYVAELTVICGNYIVTGNEIYDLSLKLLASDVSYKKFFDDEKDGLAVIYSENNSDFKAILFNQNTGKEIYVLTDDEEIDKYNEEVMKIGNYYNITLHTEEGERALLINSVNDEIEFYGKAFVHADEKNKKIIVFGESQQVVIPTPKPIATPKPTPQISNPTTQPSFSERPEDIKTPVPSASTDSSGLATYPVAGGATSTIVPTVTPISTALPTPTAVSTLEPTTKPTEAPSPSANVTMAPVKTTTPIEDVIPENTVVPTEKPVVNSDTEKDNNVDNKNSSKKIKKGSKITNNKTNAIYMVTSVGNNKTVKYVKSSKKKPSNVTIPVSIKINGKQYKVTSIGNDAFKNNTKLKKVIIGKNVKTIGKNAFSGCKNLTDLKMGENVTNIKANAFSKCKSLEIITIPSKVNKIGDRAFYQCKNLHYILVKSNKLSGSNVGNEVFSGGYSTPRIKTDKSKWKLYQKIFTESGMSQSAVYVIDPVKLVI